MADLSVHVGKVRFKNPIVAAGATPTLTVHNMKKCIEAGIGGIETKSISENQVSLRWQYPGNLFMDKYKHKGLLQTWETCFVSLDGAVQQLREIKPIAEKNDVRLIWNLALEDVMDLRPFGGPAPVVELDRWVDYIHKYESMGADIIQVVGPCPVIISDQAPMGMPWFMDWYDEDVPKIVRYLKQATNLPVCVKNNREYYPRVKRFAEVMNKSKPDIFQVGGSVQQVYADVFTGKAITPGPMPYVKGHTNWVVGICKANTDIPIMSAGNIEVWQDVVERMMFGANCTLLSAAIMHDGYKVITRIIEGLNKYVYERGLKGIDEITGCAVAEMQTNEDMFCSGGDPEEFARIMRITEVPKETTVIKVDQKKCTGCKKCLDCLFEATSVKNGKASIDMNICERCGCCISMCPANAISINTYSG